MICENCQTTLPDEAIVCWKCGTPVGKSETLPLKKKPKPIDPVVAVITLILSAVLFVCGGWAVPLTVLGKLNSLASDMPQWTQALNVISIIASVAAALITFVGVWWLLAWLITRIVRSS